MSERTSCLVPNTALTFRPSTPAFAAVGQNPPSLDSPRPQSRAGTSRCASLDRRQLLPVEVPAGRFTGRVDVRRCAQSQHVAGELIKALRRVVLAARPQRALLV